MPVPYAVMDRRAVLAYALDGDDQALDWLLAAVNRESTADQERAVSAESTDGTERADPHERTVPVEQAGPSESTDDTERPAVQAEGTVGRERPADESESTEARERRAEASESTVWTERPAVPGESTGTRERPAASGEGTARSEPGAVPDESTASDDREIERAEPGESTALGERADGCESTAEVEHPAEAAESTVLPERPAGYSESTDETERRAVPGESTGTSERAARNESTGPAERSAVKRERTVQAEREAAATESTKTTQRHRTSRTAPQQTHPKAVSHDSTESDERAAPTDSTEGTQRPATMGESTEDAERPAASGESTDRDERPAASGESTERGERVVRAESTEGYERAAWSESTVAIERAAWRESTENAERPLVTFEWDESLHPRDEHGRFIGDSSSATKVVDLGPQLWGLAEYAGRAATPALNAELDKVPANTAILVDGYQNDSGYQMGRAVAIRDSSGLTVLRELRPDSLRLLADPDTPPGGAQRLGEGILSDVQDAHRAVVAAFDGNADAATRIQGTYVIANGPNPSDPLFATLYDTPNFRSVASADGRGTMTSWNGEYPQPGVAQHEAGHQFDAWLGRPSDHEWADAVKADETSLAALRADHRVSYTRDPVQPGHPVLLDGPGVTTYGQTNPREDFAEAFRLYGQGKLGADLRVVFGDGYRPTFAEAFPHRAEILDVGVDHATTILKMRR